MELKNYQEDLVLHVAEIVLADRPDVEPSEALLRDVAAYALNRLPPRYILSERGFTRLAADHCIEGENGNGKAGLTGLVEVLLLVNKAVDTIRGRRKPVPASAEPGAEVVPPELCYWHNLPYLIGRAADAASGKALLDATILCHLNGKPAEMGPGWANPYRTNPATRGFFSFLPHPVKAKAKSRRFRLELRVEHPDYRSASLERTIQTQGEFSTSQQISSDRILNLGTVQLKHR